MQVDKFLNISVYKRNCLKKIAECTVHKILRPNDRMLFSNNYRHKIAGGTIVCLLFKGGREARPRSL